MAKEEVTKKTRPETRGQKTRKSEKQLSLAERWSQEGEVNFSDKTEVKKQNKDSLRQIRDELLATKKNFSKDKKMEFATEEEAKDYEKETGKKLTYKGNNSYSRVYEAEDELPVNEETGGIPSEVEAYKGMSFKEVLEKAMAAEKEAIFLGLYLIELSPDKYIKKFIEITNDENDHSKIYQQILDDIQG